MQKNGCLFFANWQSIPISISSFYIMKYLMHDYSKYINTDTVHEYLIRFWRNMALSDSQCRTAVFASQRPNVPIHVHILFTKQCPGFACIQHLDQKKVWVLGRQHEGTLGATDAFSAGCLRTKFVRGWGKLGEGARMLKPFCGLERRLQDCWRN
jgi:hypothetical protein